MPQLQNVERHFETNIYIHLPSDRILIPACCKAKSGFFNDLSQDFPLFFCSSLYYLVVTTADIQIQTGASKASQKRRFIHKRAAIWQCCWITCLPVAFVHVHDMWPHVATSLLCARVAPVKACPSCLAQCLSLGRATIKFFCKLGKSAVGMVRASVTFMGKIRYDFVPYNVVRFSNVNQQNALFKLMFQFNSLCLLHVSNIL